ncbi:MAG: HpcH/HpaI aldolase/citrate lyase family protein [Patescibacteria group bacterium]|jgi:citrate lyase beta subunit
MKLHAHIKNIEFIEEPINFDKYSDKKLLQYCLGATLYMPATKDILDSIIEKKILGLTSIVMCFENAIEEKDLAEGEKNVLNLFKKLSQLLELKKISYDDIPLIFLRVRNVEQFKNFSKKIELDFLKFISGFVFPKFTSLNGKSYLKHLDFLNKDKKEIIYGMPILESQKIAFKEGRVKELIKIKKILEPYKKYILNIRVGTTDFSSVFGVRRGVDYSIYDIFTVKDCLSDIINIFGRRGQDYVISAPVWEYFLTPKETKSIEEIRGGIQRSLLKRDFLVNDIIDGLLREIVLDKANGFIGKTIIHPSHIKYVNGMQVVLEEEYRDALQILKTSGGVIKSESKNKMNEISPHSSWAYKIICRAKVYGVVKDESNLLKMFL